MAGTSNSQSLAINIQRKGWVWTDNGVQGPNVAPPNVVRTIVTRQEQPSHPLPYTAFRRPDPVANFSQLKTDIITRQEQPSHPLPRVWPGRFPDPVSNYNQHKYYAFNVQEQPRHPLPSTFAGVPPIKELTYAVLKYYAFNVQEQPSHPLPFVQNSVNYKEPTKATDYVYTVQEQPYHPVPKSIWWSFPPFKNPFRDLGADTIILRQEQPFHPGPFVDRGISYEEPNPPTPSAYRKPLYLLNGEAAPLGVGGASYWIGNPPYSNGNN